MTKRQQNKLTRAAAAIENAYYNGKPIGADANHTPYYGSRGDHKGRPFASVFLARRAGYEPRGQEDAQSIVAREFGLNPEQAQKLDRVAASTHNLRQRAERVASFLTRVAQDPTYVGLNRTATTGAVAATL